MFSSSLPTSLPFVSNIFDILAFPCLELRQQPSSTSALPIDPLTYVGRTVPEFGSLGFAEGKESGCFGRCNQAHLAEHILKTCAAANHVRQVSKQKSAMYHGQ